MYNIILWNSNFRHTNQQCTNIGLSRDIEAGLSLLPYKSNPFLSLKGDPGSRFNQANKP